LRRQMGEVFYLGDGVAPTAVVVVVVVVVAAVEVVAVAVALAVAVMWWRRCSCAGVLRPSPSMGEFGTPVSH
jgi:hypothetical protein